MSNQRQRRQLTTRKSPGQKNTRATKPQEKTMTAATPTQATELKETQDAQMQETTEALKETASPEHLAAINEAKPASQQPDLPAPQADAQPDWQAHLMPVILNHYNQQLHQPRHQAEPQRRLTLPIPDRLHREIKVYCARHDLHLGAWVGALIHTGFKQVAQTATTTERL